MTQSANPFANPDCACSTTGRVCLSASGCGSLEENGSHRPTRGHGKGKGSFPLLLCTHHLQLRGFSSSLSFADNGHNSEPRRVARRLSPSRPSRVAPRGSPPQGHACLLSLQVPSPPIRLPSPIQELVLPSHVPAATLPPLLLLT